MFSAGLVLAVLAGYLLLLAALAAWAERRGRFAAALADSRAVYALGLTVYCTSWTFYGSVGVAARSGFLFLAVYLGPTLVWLLGWTLIRRLAQLRAAHRATNIGDLLAARYGHSGALAALATVLALLAINPYIALQFKAVLGSFDLMVRNDIPGEGDGAGVALEVLVVGFVMAVTMLFGLRHLDPAQRQRGVMAVLAAGALVKLAALVAAGVFVTWGMYGGLEDVLARVAALPPESGLRHDGSPGWYLTFATWLLLAMGAVLFLPHQFHVTLVELPRTDGLRVAMWCFPLYLLAITFFVFPIAAGGVLAGHPVAGADSFVLTLPLQHGSPALALLVFVGGVSAAVGMIVVSALTLSVMAANNLVMPLARRVPALHGLRRRMLGVRWASVVLIIGAGYLFSTRVGASHFLASMGLIAFAGAVQFAPPVLGGLLWARASRTGALWGLSAGFAVWAYTLFLPAIVKSGALPVELLAHGPFGIAALRPESLLGVSGLDPLAHGVAWSLLVNVVSFVLGSCWRPASERECEAAYGSAADFGDGLARSVELAPRLAVVREVLGAWLPAEGACVAVSGSLARLGLEGRDKVSPLELVRLLGEVEKRLAGSIGAATAHVAMRSAALLSDRESHAVSRHYHRVLADLQLSPDELRRRVDFHQERHEILERHAAELADKLAALRREMSARAEAEAALRNSRDELEGLVAARTAALLAEVEQRRHAEASLLAGNTELKALNEKLVEAQHQLVQSEKMASIGQLAAGVAHEINNPIGFVNSNLTTLWGYVDDLLDLLDRYQAAEPGLADPGLRASLQALRGEIELDFLRQDLPSLRDETMEGIERVRRIVKDLKDFSHVEEAAWQNADLHAGLDSALNVVWNEVKYKATVDKQYGSLPLVPCIPSQINQVFMNLLVNAAQAIPERGVITLRTGCEGPWAWVEVADTGRGIAPEDFARVFEPFYTTKPVGHGTGLGLSVSYGIVKRHGGRIEVRSEPGMGASFRVWLPLARAEATDDQPV